MLYSAIQGFNPFQGLGIADFTKIDLGGRQIRMPEDNLAYDFNGHSGSAGKCCRMPAQIMWPEMNPDQAAGPIHNRAGRFIANRKNPLIQTDPLCSHILLMALGHLLRDIDYFCLAPALWLLQEQFPIDNIRGSQLGDLTDTHCPACN